MPGKIVAPASTNTGEIPVVSSKKIPKKEVGGVSIGVGGQSPSRRTERSNAEESSNKKVPGYMKSTFASEGKKKIVVEKQNASGNLPKQRRADGDRGNGRNEKNSDRKVNLIQSQRSFSQASGSNAMKSTQTSITSDLSSPQKNNVLGDSGLSSMTNSASSNEGLEYRKLAVGSDERHSQQQLPEAISEAALTRPTNVSDLEIEADEKAMPGSSFKFEVEYHELVKIPELEFNLNNLKRSSRDPELDFQDKESCNGGAIQNSWIRARYESAGSYEDSETASEKSVDSLSSDDLFYYSDENNVGQFISHDLSNSWSSASVLSGVNRLLELRADETVSDVPIKKQAGVVNMGTQADINEARLTGEQSMSKPFAELKFEGPSMGLSAFSFMQRSQSEGDLSNSWPSASVPTRAGSLPELMVNGDLINKIQTDVNELQKINKKQSLLQRIKSGFIGTKDWIINWFNRIFRGRQKDFSNQVVSREIDDNKVQLEARIANIKNFLQQPLDSLGNASRKASPQDLEKMKKLADIYREATAIEKESGMYPGFQK